MDLDRAVAVLRDAPFGDFVAVRTRLARAARADGDRELARSIDARAKPTRAAWVANLLSVAAPDDVESVLDLGAALAEAHRSLSAEALRALNTQRNALIAALTNRALSLAAERDYVASEAVRAEVAQTLSAALADPGVGAALRTGTLVKAASWSGFGPADGGGAEAAVVPLDQVRERRRRSDRAGRLEAARRAASAALEEAQSRWERAASTTDRADEDSRLAGLEVESARAAHAEAESKLARASEALARAEQHARRARDEAATAGRRQERAERAVTEAARALTEAERAAAEPS